MPRLNIDSFMVDDSYAFTISELVRERKAGGFCVFGGTAFGVANVVRKLRSLDDTLLFSCDCEFGLPMRLSEGGTEFPDAMAMAKTGDPNLAREAGAAISKEMRAIGLGWNFAPVADVNSNPKNPIINTRSFGETPEIVEKYALAFLEGLQSEGVAGSAKHFPGHGDTSVDSHRELPIIVRAWERFENIELPPFQFLIDHGVDSIMTGHLAAPLLAKRFGAGEMENLFPATLSHALTTSLLREHMGFRGVVVTDSLEMYAITKHFGEQEAALMAFEAGTDILLMPNDPSIVYNALIEALENGRISSDDIRERVNRIRALKEKCYVDLPWIDPSIFEEWKISHDALAKKIAEKALELKGTLDVADCAFVILADERGTALEQAQSFAELLQQNGIRTETFTPANWPHGKELNDRSILGTFHRARGYIGGNDAAMSVPEVIRMIRSMPLRGLILFGSPYLGLELQHEPKFVIKTFSESHASVIAAYQRIFL